MKIGLTGATGFIGQHLLKDYAGSHTFIAATSMRTIGAFTGIPIFGMSFPIIPSILIVRFLRAATVLSTWAL